MTEVPSILMIAGRQYYKLWEYIEEAQDIGVSKRIPSKAIPEGMVPGLSKIFIAHPDAIVKVTAPDKTLEDLAHELFACETLTMAELAKLIDLDKPFWTGEELNPSDFVPESMLDISMALSKVEEPEYSHIVKEFGLQFCLGVVGYAHFEGIQVVLDKSEEDLPDDLEHLRPLVEFGYVQPVHVEYPDEETLL